MNEFENVNPQNTTPPSASGQEGDFAPPSGTPVAGHPAPSASAMPTGSATPIPPTSQAPTSGYATVGVASAAPTNQVIYGKPKGSGSSSGKTFLIAFAGALVACALAFGAMFAFGALGNSGSSVTLGSSNSSNISASDVDATLAEAVANECLPSVVSIDVYGKQSSGSGSSIYDYLYGFGNGGNQSNELTEIGLGSGVIISDDGYIITNYHVIEGGEKFEVTVSGDQKEAELVGSDSSSDVAVLKIKDGSGFKAIALGDSENIKIGEWVMSIGSPFGLEQSVATGIISATSRSQIMDAATDAYGQSTGEVTIYPNMIQTDAAINPGNSGGALVNEKGELIGINTLITSYSGNYSGVGFAIPVNYAINIAQSIIAGKEPTRAFLGITMTTINSTAAQMYGFATDSGAYVSSIVSGSPAADSGLEVGDIITKFDDKTVSSASDVMLDVRTKNPGDKVTLTVIRDGQEQQIEITLGESSKYETSNNKKNQDSNKNGNSDRRNSGNGSNSRNPFGL